MSVTWTVDPGLAECMCFVLYHFGILGCVYAKVDQTTLEGRRSCSSVAAFTVVD